MIKRTNTVIQKKLLNVKGIHELIMGLGYIEVNTNLTLLTLNQKQLDEEHYIFVGDYFTILLRGQTIIDERVNKLRVKYMSAEEKKKWELIE